MATEQSDEVLILKKQLLEKDQELIKLREEKELLEDNLDEQEEIVKELRKSFQKRIDDLTNEIDEKDEQIDSLSGEIVGLKNNDQTQEVATGHSPEVINSLKEQIRLKDEAVSEMREKLNKGGMTINNLHMEIRELKENLLSANESISSKSAKMKEMREENSQLKTSVFQLQQKLDLEGRNEDSQSSTDSSGGKVQTEVLKKEMERKNEELMSIRIKLERCQKELYDLKLNNQSLETNDMHSEHKEEGNDKILEDYKLEKSKNKELQEELNRAKSDFWKAIAGFVCFVLAYILTKYIFT